MTRLPRWGTPGMCVLLILAGLATLTVLQVIHVVTA